MWRDNGLDQWSHNEYRSGSTHQYTEYTEYWDIWILSTETRIRLIYWVPNTLKGIMAKDPLLITLNIAKLQHCKVHYPISFLDGTPKPRLLQIKICLWKLRSVLQAIKQLWWPFLIEGWWSSSLLQSSRRNETVEWPFYVIFMLRSKG